ncbi:MAG: ABC transporter ATP-binding protein, partial [bacterium]
RKNVSLALEEMRLPRQEIETRVKEVLAKVQLTDYLDRFPSELSGGQQQRVAIARAIITDPALIVADEPTGDLDSASAQQVLDLITRLNRELGKTVIMVTHDPQAAEKARTIRYLVKGVLT